MNEFCRLKGIKREFSVARTPQQNRVAKRKNRTLIEAARTMLADSLLPTVFWTKAVNTACYVQNRVLVTKPHNKTPYELIIGRPPSISFMRPFGCPVTFPSDKQHKYGHCKNPLGKFDGKAEEGFLVGGQGPNWLFDIDSLTNSMNYQPVTAGNQTNKNAGPQEANVDTADDAAGETPIQKPASENEQALKNILDKMMDQEKEASEQSDVVRKEFEAQCNRELLQGKDTKANSTNSFNTVSILVNAASAPRTSNDAGPSFETGLVLKFKRYVDGFARCLMWKVGNPTKIAQALNDESWVEAMQEERLQFKSQKVWTLVDLPYGKKAIGTKWVYENKKDERGIVVRNKARLTSLKEDGIFISQDKYVGEILKKFGFSSIRTANTPMETNKALTKDEDDNDYAGACLDRKSTIGGYQFLGSSCGQVLWIQNQMLDYGYIFMQTKIHVDNESAICFVKNPHCLRGGQLGMTERKCNIKQKWMKDETIYKEWEDRIEKAATTASSLEAEQDSGGHTSGHGEGRREHQFELMANVPITPHDSPLSGGSTRGSDEGRLKLQELMTMCTKLSKQVESLDDDLDEDDASEQERSSDKTKAQC
ncbi:putative ribonuclease H-like domain-containing protein [Tanacetum coccineum]